MKVAIVSDYVTQGGAAIACNRLATALVSQGAEVRRFALERGPRPTLLPFAPEPYGRRAAAIIELSAAFNLKSGSQFLRAKEVERRVLRSVEDWQPDVINVHNLHAFSPGFFLVPQLARLAPLVWTLHDMWSFTGRCAYNDDCRQFETGCTSSCPTTSEYPALSNLEVAAEWERRARFIGSVSNVAAVSPSQWLAGEARRGLWRTSRVEVIPNSLDLTIFRPVDRTIARAALGLPVSSRPHLLIAADYLHERRKGGPLVSPALAACGQEITLLTLGHQAPVDVPSNVQCLHLGYITDERTKALVFSAADILLHPAPTDNLPNTVLEAIACGTPVIAFNTGGLPEMVRPSITGWLVESIYADHLGVRLSHVLDELASHVPPRAGIRAFAEGRYAPASQASAYLALFDSLCASGLAHHAPA